MPDALGREKYDTEPFGWSGRIESLANVGSSEMEYPHQNGLLRDKRDDTHIGTIEKKYGLDLDARSDMHLGTYLELHKIKSLNDLVTDR